LFLALLMGIGCFASCTTKGDKKPVSTTVTQDTDSTPLPKADYSGQTYTILYRDSYAYEWDHEDATNGDTVNSAIYSRNSSVEERYGILLDLETGKVSSASFEDDFLAKITQAVMSGDDLYQLAAGYTYRLATNSAYGSFLNLFDVPNLDLTAEWWDGEFTDAASYKGVSYIANGPLSLSNMYSSACIYFNRSMLDQNIQNGTNQVFSLVDEGNWMLEDLITMAEACTPADTDGVADENDIYGFASNVTTNVDAWIYAAELNLTTRQSDGTVVLKPISNGNRIIDLLERINYLYNDSGATYQQPTTDASMDPFVGMISNRKAVFSTGRLADAKTLRNADIEYGIVPYPKWNEEQAGYYTYALDYRTSFAIPNTVKNPEMVGTVTEALAYYSNLYVKDAIYNVVLKYRDARDEESSKCIDLILNGGRYDFANIYAFAWGDVLGPAHLFRSCVQSNASNISIGYTANKGTYEQALKDFLLHFTTESE
ncbi:MAG: hypothetical protein II955_01560, partial [Clostridia bacterium]|nr:hypothetical protein [Clostridia bacterium]